MALSIPNSTPFHYSQAFHYLNWWRPYSSEIYGDLSTEDEGVRNPAGAARPEDILQIGLDIERTLEQSQAVSQLQHRLLRLHSNSWIQLLRPPLRILQVIAKMTVDHAQADYVSRTP